MLPIGDEDTRTGLPIVNIAIIAINILVFVLLQLPSDAFTAGFSVIPKEITHGIDLIGPQTVALPDGTSAVIDEAPGPNPIWLTLFTSMFMHGGESINDDNRRGTRKVSSSGHRVSGAWEPVSTHVPTSPTRDSGRDVDRYAESAGPG